MNIYCNGDSFTSGQEILDYQFEDFPGYSSNGSHLASDADRQWAAIRNQKGARFFGSVNNLQKQEKLSAWPGQLSKINSSIRAVNAGVPGSSMTGIANRTVVDLLQNRQAKFDFVFIQLTSPTRFEFYNSTLPESYFMREKAGGWIENLPNEIEREIARGYFKYYKDEDFSIKYLYTLINLKNAIKGITGTEPIFLMSLKILKDQILKPLSKPSLYSSSVIKTMIDESGLKDLPEENFMEDTQLKNNFLFTPMKHFELRCHEEFAKLIYNKYLK